MVSKKNKDKVLKDMVAMVSKTPWEELRVLYKSIWRRRRYLKRQKHTEGLQEAASTGRAPPGPRPSMHLNWGNIVGNTGALPKTLLTNHFAELYGLEKEKADSEA